MKKEKVLNEAQTSLNVFNHKFIVVIKIVLQKWSAGDWVLQNQHAMKWLDENKTSVGEMMAKCTKKEKRNK